MENFKILDRWNDSVKVEGLAESFKAFCEDKKANLTRANLDGANLYGANLTRANLDGANLPIFCKWNVTYSQKSEDLNIENYDLGKLQVKIGCKSKTISEWDEWFKSDKEYSTKRGTFEFKQIQAAYLGIKASLEFLYSSEMVEVI